MAEKKLVPRAQWASYMNTGTEGAPVWSRIGEGFSELSETKEAIEYARHYVHENTERRDVVGYAPTIAFRCDMHTGDPVIERVARVHDEELVGAEAQVDILSVNLYEPHPGGGFTARRRCFAVLPDTKGEGVEALILTGSFAAAGDIVKGAFDADAGVFTEDE